MYVQTSSSLQSASGWIFQTPYRSERSTLRAFAREGDCSRRMPETQASYGRERLDERLDLADVAAAVGIGLPEVRALPLVLLGDRDDLRPDQGEAVALDEPLARLVRLLEEEVRVELDHVDVEPELGDHVHEHRRLLLPGAAEAEPLAELLVGPERGRSSAGSASISASVRESCMLTEQHLLQRVGAQPEPKRLERDDLLGRDVAEVHVGPVLLDEPRLRGRRRRLEDDLGERRSRGRSRRSGRCACRRTSGRCPAVPPSRPSVITFQAPASRSSFSHCTHW